MKRIPWHNPAQQTPPEGYRLLIPEELVYTLPSTILILTVFRKWVMPSNFTAKVEHTYAVPSDTPLPEGYMLIDNDVWQMNGWMAHTPGDDMPVRCYAESTEMEIMLRNGEVVKGPRRQHWFGQIPNTPCAEIIGWRIVADRDAGTGLHIPTDAIKTATSQLMGRIESFYRDLMDENQRLKNELADAQATLNSIRSLLP
jgi:hypothetical protein